MNNQKIKLAAIALGIIVCSICYGLNTNHKSSSKLVDISMKEPPASSEQVTDPSLEPETKKADIYYVHICGEVNSPGVYELEEGSRVFSAVEKAGGFTENAASDSLNMAETIKDGMKIEVMDQEEAKRRKDQGTAPGRGFTRRRSSGEFKHCREGRTDEITRHWGSKGRGYHSLPG